LLVHKIDIWWVLVFEVVFFLEQLLRLQVTFVVYICHLVILMFTKKTMGDIGIPSTLEHKWISLFWDLKLFIEEDYCAIDKFLFILDHLHFFIHKLQFFQWNWFLGCVYCRFKQWMGCEDEIVSGIWVALF
jgi:hypothetical protein